MGDLRAIWDNRFFDAAALTPSSEAATLPAANVQDRLRKRVWRTTGCAAEYLTINLGEPAADESRPPVLALALINHNLTTAGQIRVQAAATGDFNPLLLDKTFAAWSDVIVYGEGGYGLQGYGGVIPPGNRDFYTPEPLRLIYPMTDEALETLVVPEYPLEAKNFWKITLLDPANPAGYLEVGRIFLTYFDDLQYDHEFPWLLKGEDESQITFSRGGQSWTDRRPVRRRLKFAWDALADVDKYWTWWFFIQKVGLSRDWIIDPFPDGVSKRWFTALYGRFKELPELGQVFEGMSEFEMEFVESL